MSRIFLFLGLFAAGLNCAMAATFTPVTVKTVATDQTMDGMTLVAIPYTRFSRGLVRFDLQELQPRDFREVERAELSFSLVVKHNPAGLPLQVAPVKVAWDESVGWNSPMGKLAWPSDANGCAVIDQGADWEEASQVAAAQSGTIALDISRLVTQYCYQGRENLGLMFRIGPTIYGAPDAQPFEVEISNVVLAVTLAGNPPMPEELDSVTLRRFPSAGLPPVSDPYIFHIFNGNVPDYPDNLINSGDINAKGPERGFLAQKWFFGPNNPYLNTEREFVDAYAEAARSAIAIHVDEWQGSRRAGQAVGEEEDPDRAHNDKIDWSIAGIRHAKTVNPDFMINVYWRGEDSIEPLVDDGLPDMLILEAQSHLNRIFRPEWGIDTRSALKRAEYARKLGMIERTILLIGFFENPENYHPGMALTPREVEAKIRTIRKQFPEMPGMAFYGSNESSTAGTPAAELLRYAENLCFELYVAPAPVIRVTAPAFESEIAAPMQEVAVTAEARDGRTIRRYDWFIDNRLMAQTPTPRWMWDTRYWPEGRHVITVHAIDSDWNRAAVQVPVKLKHRM